MRIALHDRKIGPGEPCYVIAEIGINHNGDLDIAEDLICAAADAGCDAVKFPVLASHRSAARTAT